LLMYSPLADSIYRKSVSLHSRIIRMGVMLEFSLIEFIGDKIPRYTILTYTWGADGKEVTFKDLIKRTSRARLAIKRFGSEENKLATDSLQ
jgi:hypothetical protein